MPKTILVVDDEKDSRDFLEALLEEEGYNVSMAKNAEEAFNLLKKKKFDLTLIDHFMPKVSGRELAKRIRNDPKTKKVRLAFLTIATFGKEGEKELKRLKISDYIKKPFDNEDFKKRVKKIIG